MRRHLPGGFNGSVLGLAHKMPELCERLLDGVQGRASGAETGLCECRPCAGPWRLSSFMAARILGDHDVAGLQGRDQFRLGPVGEGLDNDLVIQSPERRGLSGCKPALGRSSPSGAHVACRPAAGSLLAPSTRWFYVCFQLGLIGEGQPARVDPVLVAPTPRPLPGHVRPCLRANHGCHALI